MTVRGAGWRPTATSERLRQRAALLGGIREFFRARGVLEVDTPLLGRYPSSEPHLRSVRCQPFGHSGEAWVLQTSPESYLKRLLAAGIGPVYQLGRAFREGELGHHHQPEFTLLEWYRPGWSLEELQAEVDDLVRQVARTLDLPVPGGPTRVTYEELWRRALDTDPHVASADRLRELARQALSEQNRPEGLEDLDCDALLGLLMSEAVEPTLDPARPSYVFDFPACQAAMAACAPRPDGVLVARRFELYLGGLEIANAYWELVDADEQEKRLHQGLQRCAEAGLDADPSTDLDTELIAALRSGLPPCSGIALGVDRLLMALLDVPRIEDIVAFPIRR